MRKEIREMRKKRSRWSKKQIAFFVGLFICFVIFIIHISGFGWGAQSYVSKMSHSTLDYLDQYYQDDENRRLEFDGQLLNLTDFEYVLNPVGICAEKNFGRFAHATFWFTHETCVFTHVEYTERLMPRQI